MIDLDEGSPAEALAGWSGFEAFARATGPLDPRAVFRVRGLRRFWWLGVILIGLGGIISAVVGEHLIQRAMDGSWSAREWGTLAGVLVAAVLMGPLLWWVAVYVYALAARGLARVRYRVTAALPGLKKAVEGAAALVLARGKIGAVNAIFRWFEHKLAPEIRVEPVAAYRAAEAFSAEAFLAEPLCLTLLKDSGGWMELRDAGPFELQIESMDRDRVRVRCLSGLLLFNPAWGQSCGAGQDMPEWLIALTSRRSQVAGVRFEVGTLVRVEGGAWVEEAGQRVLVGDADRPLVVRILKDD